MRNGSLIQVTLPIPKYLNQYALMVGETRSNAVDIRLYSPEHNRFSLFVESISSKYVKDVLLPKEEYVKIACGKRVLSVNSAKALLAGNKLFLDEKRLECRIYFCERCKAFHTTSQRIHLPQNIKNSLHKALPINPDDFMIKGKIISEAAVFRWIRDTIGLQIGRKVFYHHIVEYGGSVKAGLERIIEDPEAFLCFYFEMKLLSEYEKY